MHIARMSDGPCGAALNADSTLLESSGDCFRQPELTAAVVRAAADGHADVPLGTGDAIRRRASEATLASHASVDAGSGSPGVEIHLL